MGRSTSQRGGTSASTSSLGPVPRRVVRLITRLNIGGPARHVLILARGLAPEYHTTLVAGTPGELEGELGHPQVPIHRLPLVRQVHPRADLQSLAGARRLLRATEPELVHTHTAKAGAIGRIAARTLRQRPRTVHTYHGHVLDGYFGRGVQRAFIAAERQLARSTDALVAVSPEIRDQLLDLRIGRPSQYHVITLGLELDPFLAVDRPSGALRASLGLAPDVPLVGAVGRLVAIKDHATLLRAVAALPGVHLALLGDGELRERLEATASTLQISDRVHFVGWWDEVHSALSDTDVVALTSRNEGTPVALIEAAAAGRPVVATDVGGVRTVVTDRVTGFLTPPGDEVTIASRLSQLLADPVLRARMGEAGRGHVRERFGANHLLGEIRALYADLLAAPSFANPSR